MLRSIARRIKNRLVGTGPHPSEHFEFHFDACFNHIAKGWVYKKSEPNKPVHVAFKQDERVFCEVMADQARPDLKKAGHASECCGFSITPELAQKTLKPTMADVYFDGVKVNRHPVVFSIDYPTLLANLKQDLQAAS
ncbi:hypothetical protein [Vibrio agarivorans]|uniref:hypothetical protein n=1 Tax=Vibrio agarivorans TaxID=153622 RepID=UPI00222EAEAC|nr:hypothetical protein [Vibrio agarivorans]